MGTDFWIMRRKKPKVNQLVQPVSLARTTGRMEHVVAVETGVHVRV